MTELKTEKIDYAKIRDKLVPVFTAETFLSSSNKQQLADILKKLGSSCTEADFLSLTADYLKETLKEIAIMQYLGMEKSKDFGSMGEQRVSISFCRCLLNIPNDREVTQFDADRFRRMMEEYDQKFEKKSGAAYSAMVRDKTFDFYGIVISVHDLPKINKYLERLPGNYYVAASYSNNIMFYVFAQRVVQLVGSESISVLGREIMRAPSAVLSIAAKNAKDSVQIRRDSCEVIFFNKWQKYFDQSKAEMKRSLHHNNSNIREGLKTKALAVYGAKTTADVIRIRDTFIDEMIDGIIWHEIGHRAAQEKTNPLYEAMSGKFVDTDTVVCTLQEAMADWAIADGEYKGAISRMIEISHTDVQKATRMVYVYLSDNWFIDESEEFMGVQTDVLTALMLFCINTNGSVDFAKMEKSQKAVVGFIQTLFETLMRKIEDEFKAAVFEVGIHKLDYEKIEKEVAELYKKSNNFKSMEELRLNKLFWINMYAYLKKFSPAASQRVEQLVVDYSNVARQNILKNISGGKQDQYNNDLRQYIYVHMQEIGVSVAPKVVNVSGVVTQACQAMKMPDKVIEKVQEKIAKIIAGEPYDISISYEGEKDPFIAVVQELMLKSNYGDIAAGMLVGELYNAEDTPEKRKQFIKDELENIRDQLESEMYLEIETLKVNSVYNAKPMVEELLDTITFFDSKKLREKIHTVSYGSLATGALFEVTIPLKRGYMDWNTSQAVWRINQDIRPDEFIMQWTIDKEFIESLVEAY